MMKEVMKLGTMSDKETLMARITKQLEGANERELRLIYIAVREILRR